MIIASACINIGTTASTGPIYKESRPIESGQDLTGGTDQSPCFDLTWHGWHFWWEPDPAWIKVAGSWSLLDNSSSQFSGLKMFTTQDVESIHPEELIRSELDPLIPRDEKGPTKKEERVARAQFLALCLALFVVGWTDGSTGPLLPRIQVFYNVSLC